MQQKFLNCSIVHSTRSESVTSRFQNLVNPYQSSTASKTLGYFISYETAYSKTLSCLTIFEFTNLFSYVVRSPISNSLVFSNRVSFSKCDCNLYKNLNLLIKVASHTLVIHKTGKYRYGKPFGLIRETAYKNSLHDIIF